MKLKPSTTYSIASVNDSTNVISFYSGSSSTFSWYTTYDKIANPGPYGARTYSTPFASAFPAYFSKDGSYIEKNKIYYLRVLTSNSFQVHNSINDAKTGSNPISLAGFSGGTVNLVYKNYGVINLTKAYATPQQCCPEMEPIFQIPYYTHCTIIFKGYSIDCILAYNPTNGYSQHGLYSGSILNFMTADGLRALFAGVSVYKENEILKVSISILKGASNNLGTFPVSTGTFTATLSSPYSGNISGADFEGSSSVDFAFTTKANLPSTANLKLKQACFTNNITSSNYNWFLPIYESRYTLSTKLGLGDIEEVLTFNPTTRCYESEIKNYYEIPGRLTVPVNFYAENSLPFVTTKSNPFYSPSLDPRQNIYGSVNVYSIAIMGFRPPEIIYNYQSNEFNVEYIIIPKSIYSQNPDGQLVIQYTLEQSALYPMEQSVFSHDIEPFYRSSSFYIGSNEPGSFIKI